MTAMATETDAYSAGTPVSVKISDRPQFSATVTAVSGDMIRVKDGQGNEVWAPEWCVRQA